MITVIGHINPDTDSTCSAIICAHYLTTVVGTPAQPAIAGPISKEAAYVLNRFNVPHPEVHSTLAGHQVALVDTNNPDELLPGWQEATITSIIDHHKLIGTLTTPEPITVIIRPVACTATLLHDLYKEAGAAIPAEIASLIVAAITSDTLKFTSPTTTPHDKRVAESLAFELSLSLDELADGMFTAKSDLTGMNVHDIITADSKLFTISDKKLFIGTHETTKPENALALREEIIGALQAQKETEQCDGAFFFIVDILNSSAELIVPGEYEQALADQAFGSHAHLPGIVSRKKQIVPKLEAALSLI